MIVIVMNYIRTSSGDELYFEYPQLLPSFTFYPIKIIELPNTLVTASDCVAAIPQLHAHATLYILLCLPYALSIGGATLSNAIYIINSIIIYRHITRYYKLIICTICIIYITICYINIKYNCNTWICCYFINTLAPFILSPASLYSFVSLILSIIATTHGFGAALREIYILVCLPVAILILSSTAPLISCIGLVTFTFTTAATHGFNTIHKPAPIPSLLSTAYGFATLLNAVVTFTLNAAMLNIYNYVKVSYLLSPGAYFTLNGSSAALIPSASAPPFVFYYFIPTYFGLAGGILILSLLFETCFGSAAILFSFVPITAAIHGFPCALFHTPYLVSAGLPGAILMLITPFMLLPGLSYFVSAGAIYISFGLPGAYYLLTTYSSSPDAILAYLFLVGKKTQKKGHLESLLIVIGRLLL